MAESGSGPDFRPANVRFRENGEMVLIDFSEAPDSQGAKSPGAFAQVMRGFVREFAGDCPGTDSQYSQDLFDELTTEFPEEFKKLVQKAQPVWLT